MQIEECAMGTKCAPTFLNIFMEIFEENYIYHLIKEKCKLYLTYTDGIFLIWTRTLFNKFIDKINKSIHRLNLISIIQATA